ncbi:hypothetical protein PGT21_016725 [Puccinia graminis f. sp. tritici]|uniref:Uncharacterized protein n=1 Tax=Puccinia graminis f. sp. tritici TaxID=56615 RepID=A0A5B0PMZ5_PUCGR|nr:hypothetical protein PGT21_016725 [Puccinia graminis f. sp. tritici]
MYVACVPVAPRYAICSSRLVRKRLLSEFSSEATKLPVSRDATLLLPFLELNKNLEIVSYESQYFWEINLFTWYTAVAGSWQFDHKLVDQFAGAVDRLQTGLRSAVKLAAKLAALLTAAARSN